MIYEDMASILDKHKAGFPGCLIPKIKNTCDPVHVSGGGGRKFVAAAQIRIYCRGSMFIIHSYIHSFLISGTYMMNCSFKCVSDILDDLYLYLYIYICVCSATEFSSSDSLATNEKIAH